MTLALLRPPTRPEPPMPDTRADTIHALLDRYHDARSTHGRTFGTGDHRNESAILHFDHATWTPAYRELERCLTELRRLAHGRRPMIAKGVSASKAWWHLRERYLACRVERREIHTHKTRGGHRVPKKLPANMEVLSRPALLRGDRVAVVVRVWDPGVDMAVVDAAVGWIAGVYRGTPALPEGMVA